MHLQLDQQLFDHLLAEATKSPRKRSHFTLHQSEGEAVQRMCIGLLQGTYIRPHRHPQSNKWELLVVLQGSVGIAQFDDDGAIVKKHTLDQSDALSGIEIEPNVWHSLYPLTHEAVLLEVKAGPYIPAMAGDFASWAPEEGDTNVPKFLEWQERATEGDQYGGVPTGRVA